MTTAFLSQEIWPEITETVRACGSPCFAAVAYFSGGAGRRLPLPKGSCLVVDASERAVSSGQTSPSELIRLLKRGVTIYSVPNLHAKVFVVGKKAYIGSANVSNNSASQLIEAVIRTNDPSVVSAAREFVKDLCLYELSPELLKQLAKIYRPPMIQGGGKTKGQLKGTSRRPTLQRVLLAQLRLEDWSERDQQLHDNGLSVAKKLRQHPRRWEMDDFRYVGKCPFVRHDVVIQVTDEGNGKVLVSPPGNVLHVLSGQREGSSKVSFVYLERPIRRRRQVKSLASALGSTQKQLRRGGLVRDWAFAQALLKTWAVAS